MRARRVVSVVLVLAAVGVAAFLLATVVFPARVHATGRDLAPDFTLTDIYGHPFTLSGYRNSSVVVIEFTSLSCSACQIVEQKLSTIYSGYNKTGTSDVRMISIYIEPQFGDTVSALRDYHAKNNITWTMAQDTNSLSVYHSYVSGQDIPVVVIINKQGQPVYEDSGVQSQSQLQGAISGALAGTATPISIVTVSVFALAAIAGISTFFSPCAFPMFPGYMSLFLGLNTKAPESGGSPGPGYKGAVRKALVAGSATAAGMLIVIVLIATALLVAAGPVNHSIPYLLFVVGAALIGLGALLFTNLQYWRIVSPLQRLWSRLRGRDSSATPEAIAPVAGGALYYKLFGYGMGYAAAAAGCVAPVIFAAIFSGIALGLVPGLLTILIFGATAASLMIGVTVLLTVAGKRFVNQLKALTPVIKKVSAGALVIVGVYLIYFYYTAWGI